MKIARKLPAQRFDAQSINKRLISPINRLRESEKRTDELVGRRRGRGFRGIDPRPAIYFVALEEIAIASALLKLSAVLSVPLARRVCTLAVCFSSPSNVYDRTPRRSYELVGCRRTTVLDEEERRRRRGVSAGALR